MNRFKFGVFLGTMSGASWGLNTIIIGFILSLSIFTPYAKSIFISALVVAFLHDLCSSLWLLLNLVRIGKLKEIARAFIDNKAGYFLVFSSILGGPIGMAGYLMGVKYIGPSYAASFSALYPALGTVLTGLILKEKISGRIKLGVVVTGIGILVLSYAPIDLSVYPHYMWGIIFSFVCVTGWALECVVASYAMKYGEIDPSVAICIRQMTSAIFYALVIIPYIGGYTLVGEVFSSNIILIIIITALIGSLSYLFWYKAIDMIGAPRGMSLNITYVIWTIIFEKIFFGITLDLKFIIASIVIVSGIVLIAGDPKKLFSVKLDTSSSSN